MVEIKALYPNVSFPTPFKAPAVYQVVFDAPKPSYNPVTRRAQEATPSLTTLGHYEQQWSIVPLFIAYTDEDDLFHSVADQEAAAVAADIAQTMTNVKKQIKEATQNRLDDFAATREYRSIGSAAGYAGSHVSRFNTDGVYCKRVESDTWRVLYSILDKVEEGTREIPNGYDQIESELPALEWPV